MIQVTARYDFTDGDLQALEEVLDAVMDALLLDDSVIDPDVAVSMTEHVLEAWLTIDTVDALAALEAAARALRVALRSAGQQAAADLPSQVFAHASAGINLRAELIPA